MVFHQCFHFFFFRSNPLAVSLTRFCVGDGARCDVRNRCGGTGRYHFLQAPPHVSGTDGAAKRCSIRASTSSGSFHWLPLCCCRPSWCRRNRHTLPGRSSPKINILGKPLSDVGYPHYFPVRLTVSTLPPSPGAANWAYAQDQHITYGQKHTKNESEFY